MVKFTVLYNTMNFILNFIFLFDKIKNVVKFTIARDMVNFTTG
jgi:uncharacterized protein with PQ loop repeat